MRTSREPGRIGGWRGVPAALLIVSATSLGVRADEALDVSPVAPDAVTLTLAEAVAEALSRAPALEAAA